MALVGCTVHEAHFAAAAALTAHDNVQRVTALVHVQGGSKAAPTVAALLQTLRRSKTSLAVPGTALQGVVRTERQPWETADPEVVDPAPPGYILQLVWERLPEDDEQEAAELPDIDPVPLDPLPSTVRVVCVLDPAVLADADIRRLHESVFYRRSDGSLVPATVLGPGAQSETVQIEYKRNQRLVKHPAALIASLSHPIPMIPVIHGHAQEPIPGSAVKFWGESVRKNCPVVPRSNIAGSWAQEGGGATFRPFRAKALEFSSYSFFCHLVGMPTHEEVIIRCTLRSSIQRKASI